MQTHAAFDRLADRLGAGGGRPDELLGTLAGVTGNCVACHAAYRFDTQ
jgi:cytochrome c556